MNGLSVIVPCFNEGDSLTKCVSELKKIMAKTDFPFELIVVDDASDDGGSLKLNTSEEIIKLISSQHRRGYGASIKKGIKAAKYDYLAIIDADLTYPAHMMPVLADKAKRGECDMVVGARTKPGVCVPLIRRPAKWIIKKLAEYLSGMKIPDINSGLRVMKREVVEKFIRILPDGFSLTTTITLAMLTNGYKVEYVEIDYHKRPGRSKFRAINDTLGFISLIVRTIIYFDPLKVFLPASLLFFLMGFVLLTYRVITGQGFLVISILLFVTAMQLLAIGALADLIEKKDALRNK